VGTVLISVVWLYGTLLLSKRRSGYIVMLLLSLFSLVVPYVHMKGKGVGVTSKITNFSGHFFFVWILIAIGVLGLFSAILSARGLWSLPWRRSRSAPSSRLLKRQSPKCPHRIFSVAVSLLDKQFTRVSPTTEPSGR